MLEDRYHRQKLLKEWDQNKISKATVLIAGVGALGCFVALNMTLIGVKSLILIDNDIVEISNLNRQFLFREEDKGCFKSEVAAKRLKEINPSLEFKALISDIREVDMDVYRTANVIVDCLDSFDIRRWLNSLCVSLNKPLVHGGIYGWLGNVQVILPRKTPCLECNPLIPKNRLIQSCSSNRDKNLNVNSQVKAQSPAIPTVSSIIAGIQSQETIKLLLGLHEKVTTEYISYNGATQTFKKIPLRRRHDCPICGDQYALDEIIYEFQPDEKVADLKEKVTAQYDLSNAKLIANGVIVKENLRIADLVNNMSNYVFVIDERKEKPLKIFLKSAKFRHP
ncbi:MAG: HesA/MoeB/ThiF family protein [Candidatus Odinarchaeia archaeon]